MNKFQRLQQKDVSVEQYRQQMELYMMRACIREEEATTVARFLSGLDLEIRDQVELLPYMDLNIYSQEETTTCSSSESEDETRPQVSNVECNVLNKACSLIVDSGSWCNCCSIRLVKKLSLITMSHPRPYNLQLLNKDGEIVVNQQVKVKFSIGKYEDQFLCNIVPMEAYHILLGRPW
uniref:Retrotransposon gag domain-containing protein n=1 Tax=Cajanus cajan TaxID=3821 RepID=A0A151QMW5_CAJCA|nr:hypothetical protein KK1_047934 [Cajanus cajan]